MEILSKNKARWIRALHQKKQRDQEKMYIAEGAKLVEEALKHVTNSIHCICTLKNDNFSKYPAHIPVYEVSERQMKEISALRNPSSVLAVIAFPDWQQDQNELTLALDRIQDPGNFGTIWRLADWYGINSIICSADTVDCFNPKVVQASMGAIFRVSVHYTDLSRELEQARTPVYGAFLDGENIYSTKLQKPAVLLLGNEGNGISPENERFVTKRITIPRFGQAESLNVSTAAAILISEFKRDESDS